MATKPIAVAMSGGVDSSVAAGLMARAGEPLVGFSMKLTDSLVGEEERYGRCCSPEDFRDARRVADRLGFPHYVIDMEDEFRRHVLQPFAADYAAGRTPSPCVRCNTFMKFGTMLSRTKAVGADCVATGHYAILEPDPKTGRTLLRQARDPEKDQSYFLFDLTDEQRKRARFPLGNLTKEEVRSLAREMGLDNAEKPESMDLCFVAKGESYRDFLERNDLAPKSLPGKVVDLDGRELADHAGIDGFTVGQRRGLGVASQDKLYVIQVKSDKRQVVVGQSADLYSDRCVIEQSRWIPFERPNGSIRVGVRIRSSHPGAIATVTDLGNRRAEIVFDEPQMAITPGQAAVAYDGDLVVGGGWVADVGAATRSKSA